MTIGVTDTTTEQAWKQQKWGMFSSSNADKLLCKPDKESLWGKGGRTYIKKKARERITLYNEEEDVQTYDMRRGKIMESQAAAHLINSVGILQATYYGDSNPMFYKYNDDFGSSPDIVLWKSDGKASFGAELKCPKGDTHFDYLREIKDAKDLKNYCSDYYSQVQTTMMTFDITLWLWASYNEYFKPRDKMLIIEVPRDEQFVTNFKIRIMQAAKERDRFIEELNSKRR